MHEVRQQMLVSTVRFSVFSVVQMMMACSSCSFDVVKDKLGGPRATFPHDLTIVAGTQAASANSNYIALLRFSNIAQVRKHAMCSHICNYTEQDATRHQ